MLPTSALTALVHMAGFGHGAALSAMLVGTGEARPPRPAAARHSLRVVS